LGRRSVQQLTVFELVLVLTLGSAAGDMPFYDDVAVLPVLVVFLVIVILYRVTTYITGKWKPAERMVEGTPMILVRDGRFVPENFDRENISFDEFFMELRHNSVEHLGQVRLAIAEISGQLSVYYYADDEVKPGLSVLPKAAEDCHADIEKAGTYSCSQCGFTDKLKPAKKIVCPECKNEEWVVSLQTKRVS
jgi:uncharacterized membrane protein YcaP (DUF421 family)